MDETESIRYKKMNISLRSQINEFMFMRHVIPYYQLCVTLMYITYLPHMSTQEEQRLIIIDILLIL